MARIIEFWWKFAAQTDTFLGGRQRKRITAPQTTMASSASNKWLFGVRQFALKSSYSLRSRRRTTQFVNIKLYREKNASPASWQWPCCLLLPAAWPLQQQKLGFVHHFLRHSNASLASTSEWPHIASRPGYLPVASQRWRWGRRVGCFFVCWPFFAIVL